MSFKLITEPESYKEFLGSLEYVTEKTNASGSPTMYIKGPYMMADGVNRNKRMYPLAEMSREIERYKREMVMENRSMGELNHPTTADVDLERACHMVVEMWQDGNVFYGKSKVLSTPCGLITKALINDGVKVGMSSRALGKLLHEKSGVSTVSEMRLVAIDCVADPSYSSAFVNGILESKQWVLDVNGTYEPAYEKFERSLSSLPNKEKEFYIRENIIKFINSIK